METGIRCFLLIGLLLGITHNALAQDSSPSARESQLIQPEVERREFNEALIDADDFELALHMGYLGLEDFGTNSLIVLNLSFHINPELFTRLDVGFSEGGETSYERLAGGAPLLTDDERKLDFYRISIGYNLLPGEAFIDQGVAHNTALYVLAGIGNTNFAGDDRFTFNYGVGYRFLFDDSVTFYTEFNDSVFDIDVFGDNKVSNNLQFTVGVGLIF